MRNLFPKIANLLSYVTTKKQKRTCSLNPLQGGHGVLLAPSSLEKVV